MPFKEISFLIVVFISNIIQCITGFAGTVLAMPFSLMLVGYDTAKPILNVMGIIASIGVVVTNRKYFNKKEFIKMTLIMLIGMGIGMATLRIFDINAQILYKILGIVVLIFMVMGVYKEFFKKKKENKKFNPLLYIVIIAAGIVHGMFVCGGPLLVVYASERIKDEKEFKTTLSAMWIVLNTIILFSDISMNYFTYNVTLLLAICSVVLILSLFIGNLIAKYMSRKAFMIVTYMLMAISGISLILK